METFPESLIPKLFRSLEPPAKCTYHDIIARHPEMRSPGFSSVRKIFIFYRSFYPQFLQSFKPACGRSFHQFSKAILLIIRL